MPGYYALQQFRRFGLLLHFPTQHAVCLNISVNLLDVVVIIDECGIDIRQRQAGMLGDNLIGALALKFVPNSHMLYLDPVA